MVLKQTRYSNKSMYHFKMLEILLSASPLSVHQYKHTTLYTITFNVYKYSTSMSRKCPMLKDVKTDVNLSPILNVYLLIIGMRWNAQCAFQINKLHFIIMRGLSHFAKHELWATPAKGKKNEVCSWVREIFLEHIVVRRIS